MKKLILSAAFMLTLAGYAQGQTTATQVSSSDNTAKADAVTAAALTTDTKATKGKKNRKAARAAEAAPQQVKITIPTSVVNYKDAIPASAKKD